MNVWSQLNRRPLIAASAGGPDLLASSKKAARLGADLIELRLDSLPAQKLQDVAALLAPIRKAVHRPLLATVRAAVEQGPGSKGLKLADRERERIYQAALPWVDAIDVELAADAINGALVRSAHAKRKKVILSHHDFNAVPTRAQIRALTQKFARLRGDILKVAGMPKRPAETGQFLANCAALDRIDRAFVAMGPWGRMSRIAGFGFGSCLTYGSVEESFAPGQLRVDELAGLVKKLFPEKKS